jgi:hypothetical protein
VDLPLGGGKDEDDMPLSDEDLDKIAKRVWAYLVPVYDENSDDDEKPARVILGQTHNRAGDARRAANES